MTSEANEPRGKIRILIADDQDLVRNGFKLIISSYDHLEVVGEARNGQEAIEKAQVLEPDIVLMDIRMPIVNGIEATEAICQDSRLSACRVLVLTTFDIDEYVYNALAAGASGFMLKDAEPDDIVAAIEAIFRGDALIQPSVTRRLIEAFVVHHKREVGTLGLLKELEKRLTDREMEILGLVARGLSNDAIAEAFVISPATVKTHIARIMGKLDMHDRAQLVIYAYEHGLVVPGTEAESSTRFLHNSSGGRNQ